LEGQELYKAEYQRDPKLENVYGSFEVYSAFRGAETTGRIRHLARKKRRTYVADASGNMVLKK
jgi:hypothetical protein